MFSFSCVLRQRLELSIQGLPVDTISEDCLTINVLRPSGISYNASLPVLFWFGIPVIQKGETHLDTFSPAGSTAVVFMKVQLLSITVVRLWLKVS